VSLILTFPDSITTFINVSESIMHVTALPNACTKFSTEH